VEIALSIKTFFDPSKALPTDVSNLVIGLDKRVVMLYLAVAFGTANYRFVRGFWIDRFGHNIRRSSEHIKLRSHFQQMNGKCWRLRLIDFYRRFAQYSGAIQVGQELKPVIMRLR